MGKQFQVYLLPSDAVRLVETLRQTIGLRLLAARSPAPEPIEVKSPTLTAAGFISIGCLLVPDLSVPIKFEHIERQDYWAVNTLFSEVIEFSGCHFDDRTLKRGRLFYDPGFYECEKFHEKSKHFLGWTKTVFEIAKKSLKRIQSLDAYVGNDAELWRSGGGDFIALSIKGKPPLSAK